MRRLLLLLPSLLLLSCSPEVPPPDRVSVTVASINLLHGILCEDNCRLEDRVDLLFEWIEERGCPDVVALQEVWEPTAELLQDRLDAPCDFDYELIVGAEEWGVDDEALLSRYPAEQVQRFDLHENFRHLLHARLDHPVGELDVFVTHLASSSDGGPDPCENCPDECTEAGAQTLRDCQAVQVWQRVRENTDEIALVMGDFNDPADSFLYDLYASVNWIDTYLEAGNPECNPATGVGCTSGREDLALDDLESPDRNTNERIDYVFLSGPSADLCLVDGPDDEDGDGVATRLFADEPNPSVEDCGPSPSAVCWPSDHVGVQADVNCFEPTGAPIQHPEFLP